MPYSIHNFVKEDGEVKEFGSALVAQVDDLLQVAFSQ
jgi:hypothetical protein